MKMYVGVKAHDEKEFCGVTRQFMDFEQYLMQYNGKPITKEELEVDGYTVDEAFEKAIENTDNFKIFNLGEMFGSGAQNPLFVITRPDNIAFGAGYICNDKALERIRNLFEEDYYIFPSSVHEFLVMPKSIAFKNGFDEMSMQQLVADVNRTQVIEEDRLSDSLYEYTKANGLVRVEV